MNARTVTSFAGLWTCLTMAAAGTVTECTKARTAPDDGQRSNLPKLWNRTG